MDTTTRGWDILRIRRLIINLIWTPFSIILIWLFVTTPWMFFLVSPLGLISLSVGMVLFALAQVHHELGWSSRLPTEIPSRAKMKGMTRRHWIILILFVIIFVSIEQLGIQWLRLFFPIGLWILFNLAAALVTFFFGCLIVWFWPLLLTQLYWEKRERKIIVQQGNYLVGIEIGSFQEMNESKTIQREAELQWKN